MTMEKEQLSDSSGKHEQRFACAKVQELLRTAEKALERRGRREEQGIRPKPLQRRPSMLSTIEETCPGSC
jgi:hypothetical protein